ncbi:hypothetical protein N7510_000839 [Penicillium lagena]|uniref:uncharacterized protein n=1 Tax=Penicillium lagena TaxID=94218 RepID=UPI0025404B3B|nr:uncharacterized protein N7510_000839 [Penicillium lagena]KAJ5624530.1 hypothetical protein N7510_000839 [Penicillium lagena]
MPHDDSPAINFANFDPPDDDIPTTSPFHGIARYFNSPSLLRSSITLTSISSPSSLIQNEYVLPRTHRPPRSSAASTRQCSSSILTTITAKGTSSFGKRHNKTHAAAPSTFRSTPAPTVATPLLRPANNWGEKAMRRKTTGSGRLRSLRDVHRRFKNGFQVGTPKGARGPENH